MTSKTVKLFNPVLLTDSASILYSTPANSKTIVRKLGFFNTSSSVVEISVYIVPQGSIEGLENLVLKRKLAASESYEFLGAINDVMNHGDTIRAMCDTVNVVNARGSGSEIAEN